MDERQSEYFSGILRAMGNQVRLEILRLLLNGEVSVGNIASHIELSQSAVSQHLAKLRDTKLVSTRKDAQAVYYSLTSSVAKAILQMLEDAAPDPRGGQSDRSPSASLAS